MKILDRFRLIRKRERIFMSIMKQKLYLETFFFTLLVMVMVGCEVPVTYPSPTPSVSPPPIQEYAYSNLLGKICDHETGNLVYYMAYNSGGGVAVVKDGCPKKNPVKEHQWD